MNTDYLHFKNIDELIKAAKISEAEKIISAEVKKIRKRSEKLIFAEFARRIGNPELALRLLYPRVRVYKDATATESTEYALSLARLGYFNEGLGLLNRKELQSAPQIDFYRAFGDIYRWDYESAEVKLKRYLKCRMSDYERLVAEVNLAACSVVQQTGGAATAKKLAAIAEQACELRAFRIQANALELSAQHFLYNDQHAEAHATLNQAAQLLNETASFDGFFIRKWKVLSEVKENSGNRTAIAAALALRTEALKNHYWEIARDIDFHLGIWNRNRSVLTHLYFGTPFPQYKKRILTVGADKFELPASYVWRLNQKMQPKSFLDLSTGAVSGAEISGSLEGKKQALGLMQALTADFYRPARISTIVETLYKDQYFDPFSTPNRVHQLIWRIKKEIIKSGLPVSLTEDEGYVLTTQQSFGFVTYADYAEPEDELLLLKRKFSKTEFKSEKAVAVLGKSVRKTQQLLSAAVLEKKLIRTGVARAIRYRFT